MIKYKTIKIRLIEHLVKNFEVFNALTNIKNGLITDRLIIDFGYRKRYSVFKENNNFVIYGISTLRNKLTISVKEIEKLQRIKKLEDIIND